MDGNAYPDNAAMAMIKAINSGDVDASIAMIADTLYKRHRLISPPATDMNAHQLLEHIEGLGAQLDLLLTDEKHKIARKGVELHGKLDKANRALRDLQLRLPRPDDTLDLCESKFHTIVQRLLVEVFQIEPNP